MNPNEFWVDPANTTGIIGLAPIDPKFGTRTGAPVAPSVPERVEWNFDDGSGTIKLDFPTCNVPQSGQAIYVHGQTASDEVDVWEWEPQNK